MTRTSALFLAVAIFAAAASAAAAAAPAADSIAVEVGDGVGAPSGEWPEGMLGSPKPSRSQRIQRRPGLDCGKRSLQRDDFLRPG
jgi:hypothetical protein